MGTGRPFAHPTTMGMFFVGNHLMCRDLNSVYKVAYDNKIKRLHLQSQGVARSLRVPTLKGAIH
jgi:hypothetical protein